SESDGIIKAQERELLNNVFDLDDTTVEEIMTPRDRVASINIHTEPKEALHIMNQEGFSRYPVFEKKEDNIKGIVHIKELMQQIEHPHNKLSLRQIMEPALFVPESKRL